jgi:toxin ParE1/3/4
MWTATRKNGESREKNCGNGWTGIVAHRLRFHSAVPDDLVDALDYYEEISPELANSFRQNVDRRFDEIIEHPELFPFDLSPVRFAKVNRFPYLVFFTVKDNVVMVPAVVHGASDPGKWRSRV